MIIPKENQAGYKQSAKTAQGFERMKRHGIPLPPFQLQMQLSKYIRKEFDDALEEVQKELVVQSLNQGIGLHDANPLNVIAGIIQRSLKNNIFKTTDEKINKYLMSKFNEAQTNFFSQFFEDASEKLKNRVAYALDKDEVFQGRIEDIKSEYLDTSIERIQNGQSFLRKKFITMIDEWISGDREDLSGLTDIMANIKKESLNFSKMFARDQFSRFNRALTVASYKQADVPFVKWVTVGDGRVRNEHKLLKGNIFAIDKVPDQGFNCRCGLIPVFKE